MYHGAGIQGQDHQRYPVYSGTFFRCPARGHGADPSPEIRADPVNTTACRSPLLVILAADCGKFRIFTVHHGNRLGNGNCNDCCDSHLPAHCHLSLGIRAGRCQEYYPAVIDLLAGIPSVVYGLFGILLIVPLIKYSVAPLFGVTNSGYCVLAGGLVLAIMVFPILISISFEVFRTVPNEMREASLGLGATRWETVKLVVLKKAFPGVIAAVILGFSRAFGETMAVLMVVGNVARVPTSVFDPAYPDPRAHCK